MFSSQNISHPHKKNNMTTVQTTTKTLIPESQIDQKNDIVPMFGLIKSSSSDLTLLPLQKGNISSHLLSSRPRQCIIMRTPHVPVTPELSHSNQTQQHLNSETHIKINKLSFGSTVVRSANNESSLTHGRSQSSKPVQGTGRVLNSPLSQDSRSDPLQSNASSSVIFSPTSSLTISLIDDCLLRKNVSSSPVKQSNGLSHLGSKPRKTDSFQLKTLVKQSLDSDTCTSRSINKSARASRKSEGIQSEDNNVTGTYGNDINIIEIHRIVMDKIQADSDDRMSELKQKVDLEIAKIKKPQNRVERRNSIRAIKSYRTELDMIKSSVELENYLGESGKLLNSYREIGVKFEVVSFGKEKKEPDVCQISEEQEYRIMIIERYLEVARKYTEVNIFKKYNNHCMNCKSDISLSESNDIGMLVCSVCGAETVTLATTISQNEESAPINVNIGNLKDYEDRENFHKAMTKYQGKQPNKLPAHLYEKLDEYFISINYPIGKEISAMQLNSDLGASIKTRGNSNRSLMLKALKDTGMSSHYEDINLLCQLYWGWILPDLSNLEETIMKDYDLSQEVFERHKGDRKSCLNIQYRLWRHLSRRGHPCRPNNFKIIKTPEIIKYYERIWEIICKELGWDPPLSLN